MQPLVATITTDSAFGTPLRGDTLFGQLCWMLRYRLGNAALGALLAGYTTGRPFAILSDAFPHGLLPRPALPPAPDMKPQDRKADRGKTYLPMSALAKPLAHAVQDAVSPPAHGQWVEALQPHNSISRQTSTTGEGHDPFQQRRRWPQTVLSLDVHIRLDDTRLDRDGLQQALADIGQWGFGRDASTGLGRFAVEAISPAPFIGAHDADSWLTLAPCAPQGSAFDAGRSFWKPFTRFGRHGAEAALGNAFKAPILLADTGAILAPVHGAPTAGFVGHGLGGDGSISQQMPETVHQGYAPAIPVKLGEWAA